jgi:hypothetical protein
LDAEGILEVRNKRLKIFPQNFGLDTGRYRNEKQIPCVKKFSFVGKAQSSESPVLCNI